MINLLIVITNMALFVMSDKQYICFECVKNEYLRQIIRKRGIKHECSYCQKENISYTIKALAEDHIEEAILGHYVLTDDQPSSEEERNMKHFGCDWKRSGDPVIDILEKEAGISDKAAKDVRKILAEKHDNSDMAGMAQEFDEDSYYEKISIIEDVKKEAQEKWSAFEASIQAQSFFDKTVGDYLEALYCDKNLYKIKRKGSLFYRARILNDDEELKKSLQTLDVELGAPNPKIASAGRMNFPYTSVFYGASKPNVAIAEVRPVKSDRVVVAGFRTTKAMKFLNLNNNNIDYDEYDIFDDKKRAIQFQESLRSACIALFGEKAAEPVRHGNQHAEYLPTQIIANYLSSQDLDGIIFPSTQAKGDNIVLFHKSSKVEKINDDIKCEVYRQKEFDEDGNHFFYPVFDPHCSYTQKKHNKVDSENNADEREVFLTIDLKKTKIYEIEKVSYKKTKYNIDYSDEGKT